MNNFNVGIYLRLSREDEKLGESSSISTQRDLLLNYIKENNLFFVDEYVDDGISGTTFDRKGFNRMIKDCENKKINMIITKDTSRLGRDHIEFGYYVERYFPEHNIRYVAVNDGIDTFNSNNSANDMLVFKSAFNDMYVKDISNKLRSSLYVKKKNGLFVGCYAPYGYKKSENDKHKLEIEPDSAEVVKRIFNMFINGYSVSKICDILTSEHIKTPSMHKRMKLGQKNIQYGVWSTRSVDSILKNPTYMGNLTQCRQKKVNYKSKKRINNKIEDWIVAENSVEPIVSKEVFNLANDMFKSNKNRSYKGNGVTNKLLFRGLIYCKDCHHTIGFREYHQQTQKNGLVHRIYGNCNYWQKRKRQGVCTPHSIKYEIIEKLVLKDLKTIFNLYLDENKVINSFINSDKLHSKKDNEHSIYLIDQEIDNINKKIEMCYKDKLDGIVSLDIFKKTYSDYLIEIDRLNKNKEELNKIQVNNSDYYIEKIKSIIKLNNVSRAFISLFIDKIEIDENENIDIYYKFKDYTLVS